MKILAGVFMLIMGLGGGVVFAATSGWDVATETHAGARKITVYRSPTCGCCGAWIDHLKQHEFNVVDIKTSEMASVKQKFGVPANMASCHTAVIDGYVIEGHVPADDIKRLLRDRPAVAGLSVPQMPVGTPGMEMDKRKDPFAVIQFSGNGQFSVFREYWSY